RPAARPGTAGPRVPSSRRRRYARGPPWVAPGSLPVAPGRPARRSVGVAAHGQGRRLGPGPGRHAQQALQAPAVALWALDLLAVEDQCLEGVLALAAGVLVQGHGPFLRPADAHVRRFL